MVLQEGIGPLGTWCGRRGKAYGMWHTATPQVFCDSAVAYGCRLEAQPCYGNKVFFPISPRRRNEKKEYSAFTNPCHSLSHSQHPTEMRNDREMSAVIIHPSPLCSHINVQSYFLFMCMCIHLCVDVCMWVLFPEARRVSGSPRAGVIINCESPDLGARYQTWGLCKSSMYS